MTSPIVFCDFDGTITLADVTDEILNRLSRPAWQEIEQLWMGGEIGSRQCLERQLALVETSASELNTLIDSIPLDPDFLQFVQFVHHSAIPFLVISDGLDLVIRRVLARAGLHRWGRNGIHFYSSAARLVKGRLAISFPHAAKDCVHGCATCKPALIRRLKGEHWPVIYVGDGLSDRYGVREADFVYARRPLLDFCREHDIPSRPFTTFADVERALAKWQGGEAAAEMAEATRSRVTPALAEHSL